MTIRKFFKTAVVAGSVAASAAALASGGSEFSSVYSTITDWTQGVLGKILAVGGLLVGIAFGLVRQSVIAAVIGLAMAMVLFYGPDVIDSIMGAAASGLSGDAVAAMLNGML